MDFKASGYGEIKNKPLVDKDLCVANGLYGGIFTKSRCQTSNGTHGNGDPLKVSRSGELQFPDEFALLLGGRGPQTTASCLKANWPAVATPCWQASRCPRSGRWVKKGVKGGVVPCTADAAWARPKALSCSTPAPCAMCASANAAMKPRPSSTCSSRTTAPATGFAFALYDPKSFVVLAPSTPTTCRARGSNIGGLSSSCLRAAFPPTDWSLAAGVQVWSGSTGRDGGTLLTAATKGVHRRAGPGRSGGHAAGCVPGPRQAPGSAAGGTADLFNDNPNSRTAATLTAELGVLPRRATARLVLRRADNGATSRSGDNAVTLGCIFQFHQNVQLQLAQHSRQERWRRQQRPQRARRRLQGRQSHGHADAGRRLLTPWSRPWPKRCGWLGRCWVGVAGRGWGGPGHPTRAASATLRRLPRARCPQCLSRQAQGGGSGRRRRDAAVVRFQERQTQEHHQGPDRGHAGQRLLARGGRVLQRTRV